MAPSAFARNVGEGFIRVLQVDDDLSFLEVSKLILEQQGSFHVESASSVDEAFVMLGKREFDVVVSDYEMPIKDGLQFLKELKDKKKSIPFILFTGKGREEVAIKALNLGVDYYINKQGKPETVYGELTHSIMQLVEAKKAKNSLIKSENRFRVLFENSPDFIYFKDKQARYQKIGKKFCEFFKLSEKDIIGKTALDVFSGEEAKRIYEEDLSVIKTEIPLVGEEEFIKGIWVSSTKMPWRDGNGNIIGLFGISRDITEKKKAEEILRESEMRFRLLVEGTKEYAIFTLNVDGIITSWNKGAEKIKGYKAEEIVGKHFSIFYDDEDIQSGKPEFELNTAREVGEFKADGWRLRKDGSLFWANVVITALFDNDGILYGFSKVTRDITDRVKAEEEIRSLAKFPSENPNPVLRVAKDGTVLFANVTANQILKKMKSGVNKLAPFRGGQMVSDVLKSGLRKEHEIELEGKMFYFSFNPINDEGYVNIYGQDITIRKKAQKILIENEKKYRELTNFLPEIVFETDLSGKITFFNKRAYEQTGYAEEELEEGLNIISFVVPEQREKVVENMKKSMAGEILGANEYTFLKKNGSTYPALVTTSRILLENKVVGLRGLVVNIAESKKIEEALEKSEEKYRGLFELAPDSIMTFNMKGVITSCNRSSTKLSGYSREELVGKRFTQIAPIRARDVPRFLKMLPFTLLGKVPKPFEVTYKHKNGTTLNGEVHVSLMKENGKTIGLQAVMRDITERKKAKEALNESESKYRIQFEEALDAIFLADAKTGIIVDCNSAATKLVGRTKSELIGKHQSLLHPPEEIEGEISREFNSYLHEKKGQILESQVITKTGEIRDISIKANILEVGGKKIIQGTFRDITEQKKAESDLYASLDALGLVNEKLGVVGRLTRHDVRNKLSVVAGNIYLAKKALPSDHAALKYLKKTEASFNDITKIFDFAGFYEKLGLEELFGVDVGVSFKRATALLPDLVGVEVVNGCGGVVVLADSLLDTLFYNLLDNSLRHGGKVTKVGIRCEACDDSIKLVYEDDGVGIPVGDKVKVFVEGFGKGTGLGLHMIRVMCGIYGWTIKETGKPGKGARFEITIPKTKMNTI